MIANDDMDLRVVSIPPNIERRLHQLRAAETGYPRRGPGTRVKIYMQAPGIQSRQYGAQHAKNKGHVPWMDRKTERLFAWLGVTFLERERERERELY